SKEILSRAAPLLVLLGVYWAAALVSHLNIGHRHLLPIYPPLFILAGGALPRLRVPLAALAVAEGLLAWPHYLAYFNPIAGGARNGYRHLVDSSLDWGQDLPGLQRHHPAYLAYFGTGSPRYYGIVASLLPSFIGVPPGPR